jgi:hypothetical protein
MPMSRAAASGCARVSSSRGLVPAVAAQPTDSSKALLTALPAQQAAWVRAAPQREEERAQRVDLEAAVGHIRCVSGAQQGAE